ncbi:MULTISPECIES: hypothetical protein [Pseudomonas syringae group]|uniref:Lipoprotein n=4 Tax=Pseudomonas syringae group TaxID=136849 RepID=F3G6I0_PSESJ|nr:MULTISPECIES: hypothetical protein [Pseudomonas syringae group]EGH42682.1 hypothetical protein PSYPI_09895 [Pseudomonas syringae pv. pisi str. 1704B]RMU69601.1 hypothetical protein ALP24_200012 [Pseudomonas syringae pv. aptata]OBS34886.1 hypothetical protein A9K81_10275 [Pseudomonas syringae pv. syringae]OBS39821.1 hypothetical protein A9K79_09270 [Pseudomonas syringae pv. syringae]PBP70117.1 hypothetical protein CCL15_14860 [Pseudomonas syringae]
MKNRTLAILAVLAMPVLAAETPLSVPSDTKAQYFVLERDNKGNERKITTKRIGPSGTGYSQRLVDCSAGTFKYLGDGETLKEMKASKPAGKMAPLTQGSISFYVAEAACK